jgi:hypothetical protein
MRLQPNNEHSIGKSFREDTADLWQKFDLDIPIKKIYFFSYLFRI